MGNLRKLKINLWRRDHRCHWCPKILTKEEGTVDHVKSRPECSTHAEYIDKSNKVLACYDCNQRRNIEFTRSNPRARTPWHATPTPKKKNKPA